MITPTVGQRARYSSGEKGVVLWFDETWILVDQDGDGSQAPKLWFRKNLTWADPHPGATPPANCRQRLAHEGKAYPKSSCDVCGKFSPKYKTCNAILYDAKQQPTVSPDPNVERNRQMLLERSIVGQKKYGHTTATNPLELKDWINHALEEVLDMANYLQAAKSKLEGKQ